MKIKEIKESMDNHNCGYWEALKIMSGFDYGGCDNVFYADELEKVFSSSIEDNPDLYIRVITNIFANIFNGSNISKYILVEDTWEEVCDCSECGGRIYDNVDSSTDVEKAEKVFSTLMSMKKGLVIIRKGTDPFTDKYVYSVDISEPIEYIEDICDGCKEASVFFYDEEGNYKEGDVDRLFDCKIWSHGLSTGYRKTVSDDYNSIINAVSNFSSEWQICCSDKSQSIGPFGFYVMGHVQYVSNIDLWSYINNKGDRVFPLESWRRKGLVTSPEDYRLGEWDHTEAIMTDTKIVGVWFKDWFLKQDFAIRAYRDICEVAKQNGMVVHVVKGRRE